MQWWTSFWTGVTEFCKLVTGRSGLKNTSDQRAGGEAAQIQADRERARSEIRDADQTAINKEDS